MQEIKNIIGIAAVGLTFVGYVPYLRDITKGKTKPHVYSWFLWGFVTFIAFALQVSGKAGAGSLITLAAALMCIAVIFLGYKFHSQSDITKTDTFFLFCQHFAFCFGNFCSISIYDNHVFVSDNMVNGEWFFCSDAYSAT